MKKLLRLVILYTLILLNSQTAIIQAQNKSIPDRIIFAYGGAPNLTFIDYVAKLTKKYQPSICFIPTAAADNRRSIQDWFDGTSRLDIDPHVLVTFVSSYQQKETFEEIIMKMDAIIVGGGNTLNMLAIWNAQGIDTVLRKAYENGIIMAGGSAGSLCWFDSGSTDSRPKELSILECLGFLNYSHCPHYSSEKSRRPLYHQNILNGDLAPGYAIDDLAGIVFRNEQVDHVVQMNEENKAYFVYKEKGEIIEDILPGKIIKTIK